MENDLINKLKKNESVSPLYVQNYFLAERSEAYLF